MSPISPRVDIAFKKIFGVEENKDLLISLINSMMSQEDQVEDVILLNPYNPQNFQRDKLSILDIKAKSIDGRRFNVEIQISDEADYDKRALYYWAKMYTGQLQKGDDYSQKAVGIHILNFTSIPGVIKYHNVFHITEKDTGTRYFKELELHTVELTKFVTEKNPELSAILKKIKNSLDIWATFLTNHDLLNKDKLPKELDNEALKKALQVLEIMNFNAEEREAYEGHLKWMMIEANTLKKYEQKGFKEGKEEGIAEGEAKGRVEGEIKGREEGKLEGSKEREKQIAINMLKANLAIEQISRVTGLSIEDLNKIISAKAKI
jgi:predicted transposase/invertase (TIGR01784 family)